MKYYTKEDQNTAARNEVDRYRAAAALYRAVVPVLDKYNGKVYNKRFIEALEAVLPCYIYTRRYNTSVGIEASINGEYLTIFCMDLSDNKRIDAEAVKEDARTRRADFLRRAANIDAYIPLIDHVQAQIEELKRSLDTIAKNLPDEIKDIYNLNYWIKNY